MKLIVGQQGVDVNRFVGLRIELVGANEGIGCRKIVIGLFAVCSAVEMCPVGRERQGMLLGGLIAIVQAIVIAHLPLLLVIVACLQRAVQQRRASVDIGGGLRQPGTGQHAHRTVDKPLAFAAGLPGKIDARSEGVSLVGVYRRRQALVALLHLFVTIIHGIMPQAVVVAKT